MGNTSTYNIYSCYKCASSYHHRTSSHPSLPRIYGSITKIL